MHYTVNMRESGNRWIAHVLELPGCFTIADSRETAQSQVPAAIKAYFDWYRTNGETHPHESDDIEIEIGEIIRAWKDPEDPRNLIGAFFASDVQPLTEPDIALALKLLDWSRIALLAAVRDLSEDEMNQLVEDDWSINIILSHVGGADRWFLDKLDLAPGTYEEMPDDPLELLKVTRKHMREVLPQLTDVARITIKSAQTWSPRKMLRVALWHERDHTQHVLQFRARLNT